MLDFFVTGASGFVGTRLTQMLAQKGYSVCAGVRSDEDLKRLSAWTEARKVRDIQDSHEWQRMFKGVRVVVHLIARVHQQQETGESRLSEYRRTNVDAMAAALRGAAAAGVERFVFLSSIKVNGEQTDVGSPFTADDRPEPTDAYAISKWEAEQLLIEESQRLALESVILRPALVYGPGVKANFLKLIKLARTGIPLPFGAVSNRRSLLFVDNLCDLIAESAANPAAAGETFLVADAEPVSTPELLSLLGKHLGRKVRLVDVPPGLMRVLGKISGRSEEVGRLCNSLVVDISKARQALNWNPPVSTDAAIETTVQWYLHGKSDEPG